jgi:HlyD family secretion protein
MKHWIRNIVILAAVVVLLGGATKWYQNRNGKSDAAYRTAPISRGDLVAMIGATGTVEPEEVIDVGAQVAGRIIEFGKDDSGKSIDYGSNIEAGTVLARIDPVLYNSDVASAQAQLESAKAGVTRAEADLLQLNAKFEQAQRDWTRAQKLGPSDALAQVEYDTYQSNFEAARANVAVGKASIEQAKRNVAQAEAALARQKQNLSYTTIVSPVKGVIIDRRVNIGQTVVASLNAPSLFLIAKDLKRMQVWVAVNEADVGQIRPGQPVTFTVDAFPGETFKGEVSKIRLNAQMTQNVVTYTVEVSTDNSSGKLLPYLTANVQFEASRHDDVLMVPNAALRYAPAADKVVPSARSEAASTGERRGRSTGDGGASTQPSDSEETRPGTLWIIEGEYLKPIKVTAGSTDGRMTEVHGDGMSEGLEIVVGEQIADASSTPANANPFIPQMPSRRRTSGSGGGGGGGR